MQKPTIICLMASSVDGKILTEEWGDAPQVKLLKKSFEKAHEEIGISAWLCGRTTIEKDFTNFAKPIIKKGQHDLPRIDFVGDREATSFAIALDGNAKLGWEQNSLYGDHVITILTETVADGYLAHLQDIGVSYIFAGHETVDIKLALQKLYNLFGIEKLMLEGGGHINGSFLNEGLIDELNLLILPIADGTANAATVFDINKEIKKGGATLLQLKDVKKLDNDVIWLTYVTSPRPSK